MTNTEEGSNGTTFKSNKQMKIEIMPPSPEPEKSSLLACLMKQEHLDLLTGFLSETIATGLLVYIGCWGCAGPFGHKPTHLEICIVFGLAVMLIVNIFGMVTGAQMNPAVTLAAYVYKLVTIKQAIVYMIGQLLGGYLGYGLLRVITPDVYFEENENFCVSLPNADPFPAFISEFMISAVLILVCCGVWDPRNAKHHDSVPLRFGLTITCLALVGGPYSGGSMNPARSFGPALWNNHWESHWLYWAAPMSAGLVVALAFRMIFYKDPVAVSRDIEEHPLRDNKNDV